MLQNIVTLTEVLSEGETSSSLTWDAVFKSVIEWCKTKGLQFLIALIILIVCFVLINLLARGVRNRLRKTKKTEMVADVIYKTIRIILKVLVLFIFLGFIGVDMAGVSSIIASGAVAIGLAIQGSLSNIAGWIILIVTRPFRIGDYIIAQGESGTVEEINLFYTHLKTPDNKVVFIPNGSLSNGVITNVSSKDLRRLDEVFSISYNDDSEKAIKLIKEYVMAHELVLKDPEPFVKVSNFADSSVDITLRVWLKKENYWDVHFEILDNIKKIFDENNITIPYNQLDVNIVNTKDNKEK